jgi:hypothetical protein
MAILQALIALLSRSLGRMLTTVFGWAVVAMFGHTTGGQATALSALVAAAVAWPLLLLGVAFPRIAALALAFVPLPETVPDGVIRAVWIALAAAVPVAVGLAMAARRQAGHGRLPMPIDRTEPLPAPARPPEAGSRWADVARGVPITIAVAGAFLVVFATVPVVRIASLVRRRIQVHVPLVTDRQGYRRVGGELERALARHGFALSRRDAPWWMTLPSAILLTLGGPAFREYVPERLLYLRGERLEAALYPNGLLLRGEARETAWAHGVLLEALTPLPAYQTSDPASQDLERQIRQVWAIFRENPVAHQGSEVLRSRLLDIARELRALPVDYEEWQVVYRQALQLGRALEGGRQLLEETAGVTGEVPEAVAAPEPPLRRQLAPLSRRRLVERVATLAAAALLGSRRRA